MLLWEFLMRFIAWLILIDLYLSVTSDNTCNKSNQNVYRSGGITQNQNRFVELLNKPRLHSRVVWEIDDQALDGGCGDGCFRMLRIIGGAAEETDLRPNGRPCESVAYKSADASLFSKVSCVRRSRGLGEGTSWSPCIPPAVEISVSRVFIFISLLPIVI